MVSFSKIFDFVWVVQNHIRVNSGFDEKITVFSHSSFHNVGGAFPLLFAVIAMFFSKNTLVSAAILLAFIAFSMMMTLVSSKVLTNTVLRGEASSFVLELPPFRRPQFLKIIGQTVKEKVLFVLMRAVVVAAPAGLIIWILANIRVGGTMLLSIIAQALDPIGRVMGLDGVILLGFILGFPANEIVIPIILMAYLSTGELSDYASLEGLKTILVDNGWTATTALCTCVFSMFHFPCSTTLLTIIKETKSAKWTALSVLLPLAVGTVLCILLNLVF